jgi:hypothetical protein
MGFALQRVFHSQDPSATFAVGEMQADHGKTIPLVEVATTDNSRMSDKLVRNQEVLIFRKSLGIKSCQRH